jgi:glyoxylase-like metal-dependent hydrolase (beta-lactamase superfamily II)
VRRFAGDWDGRPDVSYSDKAVLRGASQNGAAERIEMEWLGGTHTPWDSVLYFPRARVLHIADLFGWGLIPCQPTPQKTARLKEVLARVLEYDADAVICGHGPTCTLDHIRRFNEYFEQMLREVPPLIAAGKTTDEIEAQIPPPSDMHDWWRFVDGNTAKTSSLSANSTRHKGK